ncbi:PLP-dependent aminotransferase family protein [Paenibacillus oralis]|uniref:PLP-dependent aminotransferase family protein n=1 Tax=Paenibacillus oralis TaxID=2490856 RepID=A0A3P3UFR6_9BACL|nr:PLP-dependent aminotransferase family protein [Paenibacillus oralis]RRJ67283.1 PLP-dependent aminotransferase family protein [Paenibacillus oralis]
MTRKSSTSTTIAKYKQIANEMEQRILCGEFPAGSWLPSERALAAMLEVNRSTVVAAYDELLAAGIVKRIKGVGTQVSSSVLTDRNKRLPDWEQYAKAGFFQPNHPVNRQIHQFVQSERQMINFAIGELSPDLLPVSLMKDAYRTMEADRYAGYEDFQGNLKLREALSGHLLAYRGIASPHSSLLITSGAQQALHLIIQALLNPGDSVVIEDPSYAYSLPIFHSSGIKTLPIPVERDGIDPDAIVPLHKRHRIRMIFVNPHFHNPTGTLMSTDKCARLLDISTTYGIPIVEDDPYSLTEYDGHRIPTLKSMDKDGTVIYISSLSKIVASGLRIGWIAGPQAIISRMADIKQQIDFGHPSYPQWIAAQLLTSEQFNAHIQVLRTGLKNKRDRVVRSLRQYFAEKITFTVPNGGIHLWCKWQIEATEQQLFREAVSHGIVYAPGSILGTSLNHFRLTFSRANDDQIEQGVHRLFQATKGFATLTQKHS